MKSQHTPTWISVVMHENTRTPEEVSHFAGPNAGYVLRALKCHEELLQACKEALYGLRNTNDENGRHNNRITQLAQAIAKAEGK